MALLDVLGSPRAWEIALLLAQFLGALIVARMAVRWALGRYKAEKLWERKTAAMAELLTAIGEMKVVNDEWLNDEIAHRERTEDYEALRSQRYHNARRSLERTMATVALLFPRSVEERLEVLRRQLAVRHEYWHDGYMHDSEQLESAHRDLLQTAKATLLEK